jgi:hypothetical protein
MKTTKLTGDEALRAMKLAMELGPSSLVESRRPSTPGEAIAMADGKPAMVAVFTVENGKLCLARYTNNFPNGDFPKAAALLQEDLEREAPWEFKS